LKLADADLVVMNGLALEPWLHRALDALGDQRPPRVLEAADPALAASSAASNDPHVWLDPLLAKRMAERVSDALSDVDPDRASAYRARAAALADDLDTLHDLFTTSLDDCTHREFVVSHAAFGHLADRYDLEQVPIAGLSPEAEPSARELADIADEIEALDLSYVLAEPTLSARLVDTLVSETGVGVLPAHQMESVTEEELAEHGDYVGLMRDNLRSLGIALGCMA
jgi:zinc transport system substrate-binding protein